MDKKLPNQCLSCGKLLQEDFNVCPYCGKLIKITCAKCGKVLEEGYNTCPYCGQKVNGKSIRSNEISGSNDFSKKIASLLTVIGNFFLFLGRPIKFVALTFFNWVKIISKKVLNWLKSLDWKKSRESLKTFGSTLVTYAKKAISWLKKVSKSAFDRLKSLDWKKSRESLKTFGSILVTYAEKIFLWVKRFLVKIWIFLKEIFLRLRDFLSSFLEKLIYPDLAKKASLGIIIIGGLLSLLLVTCLIFGKFSSSEKPEATAVSGIQETEIVTIPTTLPVVDPSKQKWLVMVYADADDEVLEEDLLFDVNEMEMAGSSDRVQVVVQLDRFQGGFKEDGNWTGTRRYLIKKDKNLSVINSELVEEIGESNMGSTETLIDFVSWAAKEYPADRYVLIMSDHGAGWPGGWTDPDPLNSVTMNFIYLNELGKALDQILKTTKIGKFELVGLDACLMGMIEIYYELAPYSNYAVASQEIEPGLGWAYDYFLEQLISRPEMDGTELAKSIVDGYIDRDLRLQDSEARKEMLASYGISKDMSAEQLALELGTNITLSAVNLSKLSEINTALDALLVAVKDIDQGIITEARAYAQPFANVFDEKYPSPYIDLLHFSKLLQEKSTSVDLVANVQALEEAINRALIAERHGEQRSGASGFSIHFPVSEFFWGENVNYDYYARTASRFIQQSLWDDFLTFHYTGQDFGKGAPTREAKITPPGYSEVTITKPVISPKAILAENPEINIQADLTGERIAYIYLVNLFKYEDRFLFYQFDYVMGDSNLELDGVEYPMWTRNNGVISININTEITSTAVTDGKTVAFAVLEPEKYGTNPDEMIFAAKGFYVHADSGRKDSARMLFYDSPDNNRMRNIIGYYGSEENGITFAEIIPKVGDQFQFLDTWWEIDANGEIVDTLREGNTLTFGDQPFRQGWTQEFLVPGEYYIGIMAEDMDGNQTYSFTPYVIQ